MQLTWYLAQPQRSVHPVLQGGDAYFGSGAALCKRPGWALLTRRGRQLNQWVWAGSILLTWLSGQLQWHLQAAVAAKIGSVQTGLNREGDSASMIRQLSPRCQERSTWQITAKGHVHLRRLLLTMCWQ